MLIYALGLIFQFHKGTIKTLLEKVIREKYQFQFHKGTIKTIDTPLIRAILNGFQFHKGTIKTLSQFDKLMIDRDFNSIKVRLKLSTSGHPVASVPFQFHKGTIKTFRPCLRCEIC